MFDIISTAKETQWLTFPTLCSKYTYEHVANEAVDFQVVPGKNYFAEFNKKFGFELLRTTNKDGKEVIQRAKKRQFDDLSCGAISKLCGSEIAIGMTTGFIRIFSTQSGDYLPFKFKPDRIGNSVVCLDYSNDDEYLAAVYDSYDINLFNMTSNVKTDTFRFDGLATFVRFHSARKFALAIGAYEGGVTMLDIETKKKLFSNNVAHEAPVRDISMFDSHDVFVSCGYDAKINVYDLRRCALVQQHKQAHPMSSVCVSSCGTFCVAGNLKGDISAYDFRNMSEALAVERCHDSAVIRVAFVPHDQQTKPISDCGANESILTSGLNTMHDSVLSANSNATAHSLNKSPVSALTSLQASIAAPYPSSKFVDVCNGNSGTFVQMETPNPKSQDSWSELMQAPKVHDFSMDSVMQTPSQWSFSGDFRTSTQPNSLQSRFSMNQSVSSNSGSGGGSTDHKTNTSSKKLRSPSLSTASESKRRRMTEIITLEEIEEEGIKKCASIVDHAEFVAGFSAFIKKQFDNNDVDMVSAKANEPMKQQEAISDNDKENCQNNYQQQQQQHAPNRYASNANGEMISVNANELNGLLNQVLNDRMAQFQLEFECRMNKWKETARNYMRKRLNQLSGHVQYMQGRYFHSDFNHRYRHHMELEAELDLFDEGFAALFHTETVNEQYPVYQVELDDLRRRFEEQQQL